MTRDEIHRLNHGPEDPNKIKFPRKFVLDMQPILKELKSFLLSDDRGYEEMVRQVFDYLMGSTINDNRLRRPCVPYLSYEMVRGIPRHPTTQDHDEAQLAFATLYDGIARELRKYGFDHAVAETNCFPYSLDHIQADRRVVLEYLSPF